MQLVWCEMSKGSAVEEDLFSLTSLATASRSSSPFLIKTEFETLKTWSLDKPSYPLSKYWAFTSASSPTVSSFELSQKTNHVPEEEFYLLSIKIHQCVMPGTACTLYLLHTVFCV